MKKGKRDSIMGGRQERRGAGGGRGDGVTTVTRGGNELWGVVGGECDSLPAKVPVQWPVALEFGPWSQCCVCRPREGGRGMESGGPSNPGLSQNGKSSRGEKKLEAMSRTGNSWTDFGVVDQEDRTAANCSVNYEGAAILREGEWYL